MAKGYAIGFYNSSEWKKCRNAFMSSKNYICEDCGKPSYICHHKEHITERNIHDVNITLNWDNLQSLCLECHNRIHANNNINRDGISFDEDGNMVKPKTYNNLSKTIKVILGYPASGKTTYTKHVMDKHDIVLDLDRLIEALTYKNGHDLKDNSLYAIKIANDMMREAINNIRFRNYRFETLYVIRTILSKNEYEVLKESGAEFYWINTSKETCRERLIKQNRKDIIETLEGYEEYLIKYKENFKLI